MSEDRKTAPDVVEVVRCRDCLYSSSFDGIGLRGAKVPADRLFCEARLSPTKCGGFCDFGKRKGGEQ